MDPDENLRAQLRAVARINQINDAIGRAGDASAEQTEALCDLAGELAELVAALDTWIGHGGFIPKAWKMAGAAR